MLLIADALTVVYLRPYLIAQGYPEAEVKKMVVWYDPSAIATCNDRATDADAGFDRVLFLMTLGVVLTGSLLLMHLHQMKLQFE
jgi:hypothetical protein